MRLPSWSRDVTALVARIGIGLAWIAHGWPKIQDPARVAAGFARTGVYLPVVSAWYASIVEFAVAIALIIGLALPVAGTLLFLDALGVIYFTVGFTGLLHWRGDSQLALVLGVGALVAGLHGGRLSLDSLITRFRTPTPSVPRASTPT
ncbi:MAG TPA: DoxX family protein [Pseudonocardia sp.]